MSSFNYWQNLITPAILVSLAAYLINFFGRAISDQVPFADDRKWRTEIEGLFFFTNRIVSPIVGALIFISKHFNPFYFSTNDWLLLLILFLFSLSTHAIIQDSKSFFKFNEMVAESVEERLFRSFKISSLSLVTIIIIFIIVHYFSTDILYQASAILYLLGHLVASAMFWSLTKNNILIADIFYAGEQNGHIKDCRILKVNNDNIRLSKDGYVIIVNKDLISKIQIKINQ